MDSKHRQMNGTSKCAQPQIRSAQSRPPPADLMNGSYNRVKADHGLQSSSDVERTKSAHRSQGHRVHETHDMERDRLGFWGSSDGRPSGVVSGLDHLRTPALNKGMAFTIEERQIMGIHGLLPARVKTQEEQVRICKFNFDKYEEPLHKYVYLMGLLDRNEKLFFNLVAEHVSEILPIVYTPTVGLACQKFGQVYTRPHGLFITIHDKGHVYEVLKNWPETDVRAIVVTDGERILGLGDLGAGGMGIPIGKLSLYTALGGIKPHQCLPITLDVGTNNQSLLDDPLYIGLRQNRTRGAEYDDFIDEFMQAVVRRYGQNCLIQFEDFANANAFRLLEKYRGKYCTFNDDIQGTASVAVAGMLAALRITKNRLSDNVIVFQGAGEANIGIAELLVMAMKEEGTSEADARQRMWLVDSKGLIVKDRPEGGLNAHKNKFAHAHAPIKNLEEVVKTLKPSALIGAAAIGGAFTPEILREMAKNNDRPIIFALSNPTYKAECTAEQAYSYTDDRAIFASGSPFPEYTHKDGSVSHPGQANNSYIFPGLALGIICAGIIDIEEDVMLLASQTLANIVSEEDLAKGRLFPGLEDIQKCSLKIAAKIVEHAYRSNKASVFPEPDDKEEFVKAQMYDFHYTTAVPTTYSWPVDTSDSPNKSVVLK